MEQSLKNKTAKGLFWGALNNGMQQLFSVVFGLILLRNLTPDDYAMMGLLAIFVGIANTLQESGFTAALINRPFKEDDYNSLFWFNLVTGLVIYVVLFFSAPLIARFYDCPDLIPLSRVLFLSIVITSLGISHNALLFKLLKVRERAIIDIVSLFLSGLTAIVLSIQGYGYWALAIQMLLLSITSTILKFIFSPWRVKFYFSIKPLREMFGFSMKLLFSNIISQVQSNIFSVLIGKAYPLTDVGIYSQGTKWSSMGGRFINGTVYGVVQPVFSEVNNDKERQVLIFRKMLRFVSFVSFPCMLGIAFIGNDFIRIVNKEFLPCVPILQMYCVAGASAPILLLYNQIVVSHGRSDFFFNITTIYALVQILIAIAVLSFGIYWLAFFDAVMVYCVLFVWHLFVKRLIPIRLIDVLKDIMPYLGITLFVFFTTWLISLLIVNIYILLIIKIVIPVLLYISIMKISHSVIFKESISFFTKYKYNKHA